MWDWWLDLNRDPRQEAALAAVLLGVGALGYGLYYLVVAETAVLGLIGLVFIPIGLALFPTAFGIAHRFSRARTAGLVVFPLIVALNVVGFVSAPAESVSGPIPTGDLLLYYGGGLSGISLYGFVQLFLARDEFERTERERREEMVGLEDRRY